MNPQFEELKLTGNLPSPSGVGMAILRLTQDEDFDADELALTIQSDPALTGRIVKMANSAQLAGVKTIASVHEAVVRLGLRTVRNIALGFSLVSSYRDGKCKNFDYAWYWSQSLARALAAQAFSRRLRLAVPAEAYIVGLLSGIGRLALASVHPETYSEVLEKLGRRAPSRELAAAELEAFAIHHGTVAECLLSDWKMPEAHGRAIATYWDPEASKQHDKLTRRFAMLLRLAKAFADVLLEADENRPRCYRALLAAIESEDLEPPDVLREADDIAAEWLEWGKVLNVPTHEVPKLEEIAARAEREPEDHDALPSDAEPTLQADDAEGEDVAPKPEPNRRGDEDEPLERLTVLAVDDDPISRKLLVTHLKKKSDYVVLEASDGDEALAMALDHNPHIVVTDWNMPGLSGIDLVRNLRRTEIGRDMYILILTGNEDDEWIVQAFEAGVDDFVSKPFNPAVLISRVSAGDRLVRLRDEMARDKKKLARQMAELAILNRKLNTSAVTDALTELPNRRYAMARMEEAWIKENGPGRVALIMIDIDHFKSVNDTYGHDTGDAVLKEVAKVLKDNLRGSDSVCRLGGEEFVVICPGCDQSAAARVGERLRSAVENHRIRFNDFDRAVTISVGVAERTAEMKDTDDLLKAADVAVYEAKRGGRNRVALAATVNA